MEHKTSVNNNMPFRFLSYVAELLNNFVKDRDKSTLVGEVKDRPAQGFSRRDAIIRAVNFCLDNGIIKGEMQPFWLALLRDLFDLAEPEKFIRFEVPVKLKHTNFIDAFLPDAQSKEECWHFKTSLRR